MDFGFESGVPTCTADCTALLSDGCHSCGNGTREGPEVCDGSALAGETCEELGFPYGTLGCNETCDDFDPSDCEACQDCRDCNNGACRDGVCTYCLEDTDCCAPFLCFEGVCGH